MTDKTTEYDDISLSKIEKLRPLGDKSRAVLETQKQKQKMVALRLIDDSKVKGSIFSTSDHTFQIQVHGGEIQEIPYAFVDSVGVGAQTSSQTLMLVLLAAGAALVLAIFGRGIPKD